MKGWIRLASRHKEFIGTTVVVIAAILLLGDFDENGSISPVLQNLILALGVFLVIPLAYCRIMLGRPFSAIGFRKGNVWAGIGGSVLGLVAALSALFVLWNFTPLLREYRLPVVVEEQFLFFVLYEVFISGFIVMLFEVFFRGFIMLLWLRRWGFWSVLAQAGIFGSLLYASGGLNASMIPYLIFSPFAGLIAYQSGSIWYSFGASWFYFFLTDAIVLIVR
ncbi:MAG: CPBP family glutamic-type intramembrane protease [Candidatus Moraniibacteriota bacterium]